MDLERVHPCMATLESTACIIRNPTKPCWTGVTGGSEVFTVGLAKAVGFHSILQKS